MQCRLLNSFCKEQGKRNAAWAQRVIHGDFKKVATKSANNQFHINPPISLEHFHSIPAPSSRDTVMLLSLCMKSCTVTVFQSHTLPEECPTS